MGGRGAPCTIAEIAYKEGGLGSKVWESSLALACWGVLNPHLLRQRRALELGSGCGFGGVMLSRAGASSVSHAPHTHASAKSLPFLQHVCPLLQ